MKTALSFECTFLQRFSWEIKKVMSELARITADEKVAILFSDQYMTPFMDICVGAGCFTRKIPHRHFEMLAGMIWVSLNFRLSVQI